MRSCSNCRRQAIGDSRSACRRRSLPARIDQGSTRIANGDPMKTLPALFAAVALAACQSPANGSTDANSAPQDDQATSAASPNATPQVTEVASGLEHPWSVALLPDGGFLVTERDGRLRRIAADGTVSAPIGGVPELFA